MSTPMEPPYDRPNGAIFSCHICVVTPGQFSVVTTIGPACPDDGHQTGHPGWWWSRLRCSGQSDKEPGTWGWSGSVREREKFTIILEKFRFLQFDKHMILDLVL